MNLILHKEVAKKILEITEHAPKISRKDAEFLRELMRMSNKFRETFKMTEKQSEWLQDLWVRYVFPVKLNEKIEDV